MKILKNLLKILVILMILVVAFGWYYKTTLEPQYAGELEIKNLKEEVTVYFDEIGVPHINASNQQDAYVALGYVHAQDRLWQMELVRRIAAGRLSEIFGEKLIRTDKLFSGLGIEEAAAKTIENLDKNSEPYKLATAYLKGVNDYIENGKTPIEFTLVGVKKEKYTLKDMYNVLGYMAFSFAVAHKTDPMLNEVKEKLGDAYFNELIGVEKENLTLIKNEKNPEITGAFSYAMHRLMETLPIAPFIGSNSWVLGGDKTKNGKVIFANDPHIGFSQPSVWYQAHVKTPHYEMYGFHLALVPFPLLGHNKNYAYGLTMFENDDVDFYIEENNPNNENEYKYKDYFLNYTIVEKRLKIKDKKDSLYTIKTSKHGPLMNGIVAHLEDNRPIAMQWIYTKLENKILEVAYEISHAKNLTEFKNGASKLHAPGLNIMYGDSKNNIAWFASGKLYKYRDSLYTKTFLNGSSGKDEIVEYLNFDQNPQAINPSNKYVYSANNQPDSIANMLYPGYYLVEDRAKRIVELLAPKNNWTKNDVAKMLLDNTSPNAPKIAKNLLNSLNKSNLSASEKTAIHILKNWKGNFDKNEVAPVIYNRFIYEFQKNTFADEMGKGYSQLINTPFIEKVLPVQAKRENSVWWDNVSTKDKIETKQEIVTNSFKNAFSFLENQLGTNVERWKWERVISVEYKHAVGEVAVLRSYFNVGPFVTAGGDQVINNQIYNIDSTGVYKVLAGPSTRRIVDFSDVDNSWAIVPTGQSGRVFSKHYKDQAKQYLNGEFVKMNLNKADVEKSKNVLILKPKKE
ncbi:penicillin acylase family protein [Polaribacter batillariae]|uniref:Penicillin acylase family protein n=1 Tax=Polaribacter batillariae TaxID=2808900 RepID=A0ABX7T1C7_9FLAO|nr:penicillin acylase family protein [Polaribacter batillariae]QTD38804.1 penicillin acylase family protein [Polaribacter batillariae]